MSEIDKLPPLREVIAAHDLRAEKKLGQNFILDLNLTDKIARCARDLAGVNVVEIGPGPGGLTRSLLKTGAKSVTAVEYDARAVEALQSLQQVSKGRLNIIHGDALKTDLTCLVEVPRAIVANLPYNIATPLMIGWLRQIRADMDAFRSMTLMVQREVAERLTAVPGTKNYGRLSVIAQWLCTAVNVMDVPPSAFTPPPKVTSSVVHFLPGEIPKDVPAFETVEKVTAAAFGQRRKMIRSTLKDYAGALEELGIDPVLRAENLSVEDFIAISGKAKLT